MFSFFWHWPFYHTLTTITRTFFSRRGALAGPHRTHLTAWMPTGGFDADVAVQMSDNGAIVRYEDLDLDADGDLDDFDSSDDDDDAPRQRTRQSASLDADDFLGGTSDGGHRPRCSGASGGNSGSVRDPDASTTTPVPRRQHDDDGASGPSAFLR